MHLGESQFHAECPAWRPWTSRRAFCSRGAIQVVMFFNSVRCWAHMFWAVTANFFLFTDQKKTFSLLKYSFARGSSNERKQYSQIGSLTPLTTSSLSVIQQFLYSTPTLWRSKLKLEISHRLAHHATLPWSWMGKHPGSGDQSCVTFKTSQAPSFSWDPHVCHALYFLRDSPSI